MDARTWLGLLVGPMLALAAGCSGPAPAPPLHVTPVAVWDSGGLPHGLSVVALPADSVVAAWSSVRDAADRSAPRTFVATARDHGRWDRLAVLDSTSGDEVHLIRAGSGCYALLRNLGKLYRLGPGLDTALVNALALPGAEDKAAHDAVVIEPDSLLVAYSVCQQDAQSHWRHRILLGSGRLGKALARFDTVATYPAGDWEPRIALLLLDGQPVIAANHLAADYANPDPTDRIRSYDHSYLSLYARAEDGAWRRFDFPRREGLSLRDFDLFARDDSVCVLVHSGSRIDAWSLDRRLAHARFDALGQSEEWLKNRNEPSPEAADARAGPQGTTFAWIRTVQPIELLGPLVGSLVELMPKDEPVWEFHVMLGRRGPAGRPPPDAFDVTRALRIPHSERTLEVARSGTDTDGVLLVGSSDDRRTPHGPQAVYRVRLVRYGARAAARLAPGQVDAFARARA